MSLLKYLPEDIVFGLSEQTTSQNRLGEEAVHKNRKALIIAVSDYDELPKSRQLSFCKNDGEEMYKVLSKYGYEIPFDFKLTGKVEGTEMKDKIIDFFSSAKSTDTLIFYFSGHGMPDGHGNYFLAASDIDPKRPQRRGYAFYELEQERKRCISKRIVTILDCCFSGAAQSGTTMVGDEEGIANVARDKMDNTFKEGDGRCLLASSLGDQLSYKMRDKDFSIFTYFLIEGIKGANGTSVDSMGYVTASSLSSYLYNMITTRGRQKPITKTAQSGELIIAHHPHFARPQEQTQRDLLLQLLKDGRIEDFNRLRISDKGLSLLDLSSKDFTGANLARANLTHAIIPSNLREANLSYANMSGARFGGTNLSYCNLSYATLIETFFSNACLDYADLSYADLTDSKLMGYDPPGTSAYSARFSHATIRNSDLNSVYFVNADMSSTDLDSTRVRGSLENVDLSYSNLTNAQLMGAEMSYANLSHATISNANLSSAKLPSSIILGCTMYDKLTCYEATFKDSIIDNENLVGYLRAKGAVHVPDPILDKKELISRLRSRGLKDPIVKSLIRISNIK